MPLIKMEEQEEKFPISGWELDQGNMLRALNILCNSHKKSLS